MSTTKWPMINDITVGMRHMPSVTIGASVSLTTGRPIVDFRFGDLDEDSMTPAEARRLAAALVKAADCCDAKTAAAKVRGSSPAAEEGTANG